MNDTEYLNTYQAAKVLGLTPPGVKHLVYFSKKLTAYKNGAGHLRFDPAEVMKVKADREAAAKVTKV